MFYFVVCSLLLGADQGEADAQALQGKWEIVRFENPATGSLADYIKRAAISAVMIVEKDRVGLDGSDKGMPLRYTIDSNKSPKQIDLVGKDGTRGRGIYLLKGDELKVCFANDETTPRPTKFELKECLVIVTLRKKK
jgi:uncharacterized protein (TIGR03067 family)